MTKFEMTQRLKFILLLMKLMRTIIMKRPVMKRRPEKKKSKTKTAFLAEHVSILTFVFSFVIACQHKRRYEWHFNGCIKYQDQNHPIPSDFKKAIVQDNSVPHLIGNLIFVALVLRPPSLKRRHNLKEHKIKNCNLGVNKVYVAAMYVCI